MSLGKDPPVLIQESAGWTLQPVFGDIQERKKLLPLLSIEQLFCHNALNLITVSAQLPWPLYLSDRPHTRPLLYLTNKSRLVCRAWAVG